MAVEAVGLIKRYGDIAAVDGISLSIPHGSLTAVLGPNGAGKTTTLEMLEGFRRPDAGSVRTLGVDPQRFTADQRARVGVMLQSGGVWSTARPAETIAHLASFFTDPWPVADLIERLDLGRVSRTPFRRLSGGEQQRTKLACAVVGRPRIAFLDEPTAGLDPHSKRAVWDLIEELRGHGTTILLSTHLMDEAERLADRILIIHRGRVRADGTAGDLLAGEDADEMGFVGPPRMDTSELLAALPHGYTIQESPTGRYRCRGALTPQAAATLTVWCTQRNIPQESISYRRRTLEDVFLQLTGHVDAGDTERTPA